jgi:hypothetical protein
MLRIINNQKSSFGMKFAGGGESLIISDLSPILICFFAKYLRYISEKRCYISEYTQNIIHTFTTRLWEKRRLCLFSGDVVCSLRNPPKLYIYAFEIMYIQKFCGVYI